MRVGIANPFAYRPHVAHMAFIDRQLRRLGHLTFFLGCGGRLDNCASRASKAGVRRRLECVKCRAGSIRSYLDVQPARIDAAAQLSAAQIELGKQWSFSTACTTLQVEHAAETAAADFQSIQESLSVATATGYVNTRRWIRDQQLDCVFVFNGRYDLTRAIVEACLAESTRFVSVERSWFGDGLQLLPQENCLGLRTFHAMGKCWAARPLTQEQAERASGLIGRRLSRVSRGEWRQYNLASRPADAAGGVDYLFLPSSQHEWLGDADRSCGWDHPTDALEYLFAALGVGLDRLVLRGHPAWAMKIKNFGGNRANTFYRDWARRVGARYIEPSADVDTHSLMRIAKVILLNASSASLEAAWLGKPVVCFAPAAFTTSGISCNLFDRAAIDGLGEQALQPLRDPSANELDALAQCQRGLRFLYCANFRIMQFVDSMKAVSPFSFRMVDPPDLRSLESLVTGGELLEDDAQYAADDRAERRVASDIIAGRGERIGVETAATDMSAFGAIRRRHAYRLIDLLSG
jgi:hypothetical protein